MLGTLGGGTHQVSVFLDDRTPAPLAGKVAVTRVEAQVIGRDAPEHTALSHSPILRARPGSLEKFSDLPMVTWYSTEPSPRGTWIRYSVIFTNEDGGTPPDRLMATWGRLTDIEYVFGVEIDAAGRVLAEEYQGPDHKYLPFEGEHDGGHPVLHVVTENNMVSDRGGSRASVRPGAVAVPDRGRGARGRHGCLAVAVPGEQRGARARRAGGPRRTTGLRQGAGPATIRVHRGVRGGGERRPCVRRGIRR